MTHPTKPESSATALLQKLSGTPLDTERLQQVVDAYAPIFDEIARLHSLDLQDVHPAVVYEPTAAYRKAAKR